VGIPEIVFLGPQEGYDSARLVLRGDASLVLVRPDASELRQFLPRALGVIDASMQLKLSRDMFAGCNEMQLVACASTGTDHVDRSGLGELGIEVWCLRDDPFFLANINSAAEATWALALSLLRKVPWANSSVLEGKWQREAFSGTLLRGRTLGILGLGRLGTWVAKYGNAFEMTVLGNDPDFGRAVPGVQRVSIEELFARSDLLSIHVPLTEETKLLVSESLIFSMKPGESFIVNSSRGDIVDENALLRALESGHLAGAALDVLQGEPETANHPLVLYAQRNQNLLLTPHFAGLTKDSIAEVCARAAQEVLSTITRGPK